MIAPALDCPADPILAYCRHLADYLAQCEERGGTPPSWVDRAAERMAREHRDTWERAVSGWHGGGGG